MLSPGPVHIEDGRLTRDWTGLISGDGAVLHILTVWQVKTLVKYLSLYRVQQIQFQLLELFIKC